MDCLAAGSGHGFFLCQKWKQPLPDFSKSRSSRIAPNLHVNKGSHTAAAEASLNRRLHERSRKPNERDGASITNASDEEQVPPSSRFLASKDVDFRRRSSNLNKASEDQVLPPSSKNVDLNSTNPSQNGTASFEKLTSDKPNDINVTSSSKPTISRPSETEGASIAKLTSSSPKKEGTPLVAKLTNSNPKQNDRGYIEKVTSDDTIGNGRASIERSCKDQVTPSSQLLAAKKVELPSNSDDQNERIPATTPPSVSEDDIAPSSGLPAELHSNNPGKSGRMSISASPSFPDDHKVSLSHLLASKNIIEFISRFPAWADAQKESGMPQRQKRAFYSHTDWLRHRSSLRYVRHMLSSFSSRVIVSLILPVFTFTAGSMVVATYNTAVNFGLFPTFFPLLHAASLPYELTAPALALLLVFRTDASYSRYDEARKTWTSVISTTKDFARHSAKLIKSPQDVALKSSLLTYIMAFPVSLKCHLIHRSDMRKDLQGLLEGDDLEFVLASCHQPNCIILLMSQTLGLVQLENTERVLLEGHITQYNASVSVCERLIRTPIPLSYTRLTSRFLVLWHMSLPIVLWDSCNWLVVPATFFSAATLFYIEEVGVLIEEPFPMLALDKIIGIAHDNIRELMELQQHADEFLSRKRKLSSDGSAYGAGTKGSSLKSNQ